MIMLAYADQCGSIFRKNAELQDAKYSMSKRSLRHRKDNLELYKFKTQTDKTLEAGKLDVKKAITCRN